MNLSTKFNIGDEAWAIVRNKPFKVRITAIKVTAKETIILEPNGESRAVIKLSKRYLINRRWTDEEVLSETEQGLKEIRPWLSFKDDNPKEKFNIRKRVSRTDTDDIPL